MSYCNAFPRVTVTGLANGWNRNKSLTALGITVPSDATYAILEYASGTGTAYGFGNYDKVPTDTYAAVGTASIFRLVELSATKTIDLYLANATSGVSVAQWHVHAILNHLTALASPVDIGSFSGAGTKTIDCSAIVPSGAISGSVLIEFNLNMKVGPLTNITTQGFPNTTERCHRWVPLDANRYFYVVSGGAAIAAGAIKILAWAPPNCIVWDTNYTSIINATVGNVFDSTGFPTATTAFDYYQVFSGVGGSDASIASLRTYNNTGYTALPNMAHRTRWVKPNSSGLVEGAKNVATTGFIRFMGIVGDTAAANISSISTFVAGATATVVFSKPVTTVNKIRATCAVLLPDGVTYIDSHYIDITGFSGSGATWTFTVPSPTNATDGIRFGTVTLTPTTDGSAGADFTSAVYSKTDYDSVNIETPVSGNVCEGDTPALSMDDQLAYQYGEISIGGVYSDPTESFIGTQTIWHYSVSDYKWYSFTLTTESGGTPTSGGGLTSSGLTSAGLTNAGLTRSGL